MPARHPLAALRALAERNLAEARQLIHSYFRERDSLEPLSRKELLRRMRGKQVTVLDVRSSDEFAADHLPTPSTSP